MTLKQTTIKQHWLVSGKCKNSEKFLSKNECKQTNVFHLKGTLLDREFVTSRNKLSYSTVKEQVHTLRDVTMPNIIKYLNDFFPLKIQEVFPSELTL